MGLTRSQALRPRCRGHLLGSGPRPRWRSRPRGLDHRGLESDPGRREGPRGYSHAASRPARRRPRRSPRSWPPARRRRPTAHGSRSPLYARSAVQRVAISPGAVPTCRKSSAVFTVNMKNSPARIDSEKAEIGRPTAAARRLVEDLRQPEHASRLRQRAPAPRRLARRPRVPRRDAGRLPRRAARRRPRLLECLDGGRRRVLPREARRTAHARLASGPPRVLAGYRRTASDRGRGQARQ